MFIAIIGAFYDEVVEQEAIDLDKEKEMDPNFEEEPPSLLTKIILVLRWKIRTERDKNQKENIKRAKKGEKKKRLFFLWKILSFIGVGEEKKDKVKKAEEEEKQGGFEIEIPQYSEVVFSEGIKPYLERDDMNVEIFQDLKHEERIDEIEKNDPSIWLYSLNHFLLKRTEGNMNFSKLNNPVILNNFL